MTRTTHELTAAVASGDPDAVAAFYEQWFEFVYRQSTAQTRRDEAFALDIVQDVMMKVIRSMPAMKDDASVGAWLRRVTQNCVRDRVRRESARTRRESSHQTATADGSTTPRDSEATEWLGDRVEQLDPRYREPLLMRYRFGWTLAQIGRALGLSIGAVDRRLARAIALLQPGKEDVP